MPDYEKIAVSILLELYFDTYPSQLIDYETVDGFYANLGYNLNLENEMQTLGINSTSDLLEALTECHNKRYGDKTNEFWRIGCVEITEDADNRSDAKRILGEHLQEYPSSHHWMALGRLDDQCDFIAKGYTLVEID